MKLARGPLSASIALHAHAFGRSSVPLLLATAVALAVVLGGHGVDPREVARLVRASAWVRLGVAIGWASLARAGARTLLLPPGSAWMRSAPLSPIALTVVAAAFVFLTQAPPLMTLLAGRDVASALSIAFVGATLASAPRDRYGLLSIALPLALLSIEPQLPGWNVARAAALAIVFSISVHRAFVVAPERTRVRAIRWRRLPAFAHLVLVHTRTLVRGRPLALVRSSVVVALSIALVHRARIADRTGMMQLGALVTLVSGAPLLSHVGRTRRLLDRFVRASAQRRVIALGAAVLVVATPSLAFAGALAPSAASAPHAISTALFCVVLALLLVRLEHRLYARRRDANLVLVLQASALAVVFGVLATLHEVIVGLVLVACATLGVSLPLKEVAHVEGA